MVLYAWIVKPSYHNILLLRLREESVIMLCHQGKKIVPEALQIVIRIKWYTVMAYPQMAAVSG